MEPCICSTDWRSRSQPSGTTADFYSEDERADGLARATNRPAEA